MKKHTIVEGFAAFKKWAKFDFEWSSHSLRRTTAPMLHMVGVDIDTIALILGNTPRVVMEHYIISSIRSFDACCMANSVLNGTFIKVKNLFTNDLIIKPSFNQSELSRISDLVSSLDLKS